MDLAFLTAHHPGQRERPGGVCHQFHFIVQFMLHPIQGGQLFAFLGSAGDNIGRFPTRPVLQDIIVKGVQRLTQFQHDIIGGIHNAVDRAHPSQVQPALNPVGAGLNFDPFNQTQNEARVEVGILNMDRGPALDGFSSHLQRLIRVAQCLAGSRRDLTGHAQHAGIPHHVGQGVHVKDRVAHKVGQRRASRRVPIQQNHALVLIGDAQFLLRADHGEGFHAADLHTLEGGELSPRLVPIKQDGALAGISHFQRSVQRALTPVIEQVGRARQHNQLFLAVAQPAQHQPVSIGVRHNLLNLSDDELLFGPGQAGIFKFMLAFRPGPAHQPDLPHLQPDQRHRLSKFFNA